MVNYIATTDESRQATPLQPQQSVAVDDWLKAAHALKTIEQSGMAAWTANDAQSAIAENETREECIIK